MSRRDDDEADERRRQERERAKLSGNDLYYGTPPAKTNDGSDDGRSKRRTGRVSVKSFRMHPRVKALWDKVREREGAPSDAVMLEVLLALYQEHHGAIDEAELPTDEELAARMDKARDDSDGASADD